MISLGVFLSQELIRFNGLIAMIAQTLTDLLRAVKGEVVMSASLELMYNNLVYQRVPLSWEEVGYPCLKPLGSWTEDFFARLEFMRRWLVDGPPPAYWLSGFFFPQGFMTAVKQTYSRDLHIAIDTLRIGCQITSFESHTVDSLSPPVSGAFIYGLYMEGGRFDRNSMSVADAVPGVLFNPLPCIWLTPVLTAEYKPVDVYNCPLYKTSLRAGTLSTTGHSTNFVVALPLPSKEAEDYWVRKGCALLCMLDD